MRFRFWTERPGPWTDPGHPCSEVVYVRSALVLAVTGAGSVVLPDR